MVIDPQPTRLERLRAMYVADEIDLATYEAYVEAIIQKRIDNFPALPRVGNAGRVLADLLG